MEGVTAPLAAPYVATRDHIGERTRAENLVYSAHPGDYLKVHPRSWLYGRRLEAGAPERALFPGVAPLVLATAAFVPPLSTLHVVYGAALVLSFDASLGFNGTLYPRLHRWLFPIHALRVPARFSVFVGLTLAILAGLTIARVQSHLPGSAASGSPWWSR